jgi:hypothetical protein
MEYFVIGGIALVVFIILTVMIKVKQVRDRVLALFLQAEKYVTEDKMEYVCENAYNFISTLSIAGIQIGSIVTFFLKQETFNEIVQRMYDKTRSLAKDILDDGKINKSNKEE